MEIIQGHSYKFDTKSATNIDSHEDDEKNNSHECLNLMNQMKPPMMKMWRRMKLVMKILSISQEKKILEEITEQCAVTDLLINCFFYTPVLHTVRTKLVLLTLSYQNLTYF